MDIHSATEEAYKKGYEDGKRDSVVSSVWETQADGTHFCDRCGYDAPYNIDGDEYTPLWCPHCGARMHITL